MKGRHGDGEYDTLGRPAIYTTYRPERTSKKMREIEEKNERRRRVESYVKTSNMSLVSMCVCVCVWESVCVFDQPFHPALYSEPLSSPVSKSVMMLFLEQDSGLHQDQSPPPPPSVSSGPTADGWKREIHRAEREKHIQREREEEEEESCAEDSYRLSEATSNYFQCSNDGLTPRANPNAIIIHSRGQVIWSLLKGQFTQTII